MKNILKNRIFRNTIVYALLLLGYVFIYEMRIFKKDGASGSKVDFVYQQF